MPIAPSSLIQQPAHPGILWQCLAKQVTQPELSSALFYRLHKRTADTAMLMYVVDHKGDFRFVAVAPLVPTPDTPDHLGSFLVDGNDGSTPPLVDRAEMGGFRISQVRLRIEEPEVLCFSGASLVKRLQTFLIFGCQIADDELRRCVKRGCGHGLHQDWRMPLARRANKHSDGLNAT
jgi:hypothetical protein